jgi:hypothetical protein
VAEHLTKRYICTTCTVLTEKTTNNIWVDVDETELHESSEEIVSDTSDYASLSEEEPKAGKRSGIRRTHMTTTNTTNSVSNIPYSLIFKANKLIAQSQNSDIALRQLLKDMSKVPEAPRATRNRPKSGIDMYTPRWVRGGHLSSEGLCPYCFQAGTEIWLKTKSSAYWFHLSFHHGISSKTFQPFPRLPQVRESSDGQREVLCENCDEWINLTPAKQNYQAVESMEWWRHCFKCTPKRKR